MAVEWLTVKTTSSIDAIVTDEDCETVANLYQCGVLLKTLFAVTVRDLMLAGF